MNETLKTIAQRYSCRAYSGQPVEKDKLEAVALAAVQSPSAMNRQPWQIAVVTDKVFLRDMEAEGMRVLGEAEDKTMFERMKARGGKVFYNAPCMFIVFKQPGTDLDIGIVSQNIALAASSLGLGNVICGMAGIPFAGPKGKLFKERIGCGDGWEFGVAVLVGYAESEGAPHEPDMSKLIFVE